MEQEAGVRRSRRAVLGAVVGGAAAVAASAVAGPASVLATQDQPANAGQLNTSTDPTTFQNTSAGENSLQALHADTGTAFYGESGTGAAVMARVIGSDPASMTARATGVWATVGNTATAASDTSEVGVYGFSDTSGTAVGVWGDSAQGVGVYGTGDIGIVADGGWGLYGTGAAGVVGDVGTTGVGVYGFTGSTSIPTPPAGVGVYARAASTSQTALQVQGKLKLSRSGRVSISSSATTRTVTMAGVTTSSYVVATLQTSVSGCYVRAVVPASGSFKIYLSKAPGKTVYVGYVVIN